MSRWTLVLAAVAAATSLAAASPAPLDTQQGQHQHQPRAWPYLRNTEHLPPIASTGCGKAVTIPPQVLSNFSITVPDVEIAQLRNYSISLPSNYDLNTATPVIFSFHDDGGNATTQQNTSDLYRPDFSVGRTQRDYIVVYPESTEEIAGKTWGVSPDISLRGVDDMAYITALLTHVKAEFCVDETRVYATGFGTGGGMANALACHPTLSTQFAAFAPVSGAYFYPWPDMPTDKNFTQLEEADYFKLHNDDPHCLPRDDVLTCDTGSRKGGVPILAIHGQADLEVTYPGRSEAKHHACTPSIDHWAAEWAKRNGLGPEDVRVSARTWDDPDPNPALVVNQGGERRRKGMKTSKPLGADTKRYVYGERSDPRGLVTLVWHGGAHEWPRPPAVKGGDMPPTALFNATSMILEFFERFTLHDENPRAWMVQQQPITGGTIYQAASSGGSDSEGGTWLAAIETMFVGLLELLHLA